MYEAVNSRRECKSRVRIVSGNKIALTFRITRSRTAFVGSHSSAAPSARRRDRKVQADFGADENQIGIDVILGNTQTLCRLR
jgi:hypothetical protein